ncbi:hypothetical protein K469DRAFT_726645 [Zopfia rhizophila CBS 207.26]|uniref:Uncharacterized protein n=1 Tax=Zopfia rhizophila CBS 207.26 TaxID=1314779 RepID=A0A6A6E3U3_9PEZI|nr:hypothetical protein K469DRAFT_726645 [Zopfia rhizophila CBS 207.26]
MPLLLLLTPLLVSLLSSINLCLLFLEYILNALQNAAKRRNKITVVRKEQQAKKLGAIKFIPPLDTDTTQANIYYIKKRFIRFYYENKHGPWIKVIKTKNCDKGFIMIFLRKRLKKKTFDLDVLPKPKLVMGVDDLLLGLIVSDSVVTSRDDIGDTGGDDGEIESDDGEDDEGEDNDPVFNDTNRYDSDVTDDIDLGDKDLNDTGSNDNAEAVDADNLNDTEVDEFGDPIRKHKVLCYEDITFWIVKDPKQGGRDILVMEVYFRYYKGADNKPKPTIFLFREHSLAILCPISYILARVICDDAIQVDGYSAVKVYWKLSKLKILIFRTSVRAVSGRWEKLEMKSIKYSTYVFYLNRIGTDLGSEEKWTSYYEMTKLQAILCDFNMNLDIKYITDRKICAINLIVVLVSRREIHSSTEGLLDMTSLLKLEEIPLILERTYRVSYIIDYIEKVHLKYEPVGGKFVCYYSNYKPLDNFLRDLNKFKNHV